MPTPASEPAWEPELAKHDEQAVAVFDNYEVAARVADELVAAGVDRRAVHLSDPPAVRGALLGEMREEADHTFIGMGAMSKEETRGAAITVAVGAAIGGVIGLLVSLIGLGFPWWERALVFAGCGAGAGAMAGFIPGAGFMARGPASPPAAVRGTTVAVTPATQTVIEVLARHDPVRLDLLTLSGETLGAVTTEEDRRPGELVRALTRRFRKDPGAREWAASHLRQPQGEHTGKSAQSMPPTERWRPDGGTRQPGAGR